LLITVNRALPQSSVHATTFAWEHARDPVIPARIARARSSPAHGQQASSAGTSLLGLAQTHRLLLAKRQLADTVG
jgi:hypothetical protein